MGHLSMGQLLQKRIILGISGSIAAYKSAYLTRLLVKQGAEVKVIMTEAATQFISPLTLSTLSKHPVSLEIMDDDTWNNHVELGLWADFFIIAPASANTLSKLADGQSDNMLVATYLSARCPVFIAPAMDVDMWHHGSTRKNIDKLLKHGDTIIPVEHGELASGLVGEGRMAEPEQIVSFLMDYIKEALTLNGKSALVTAGPTYEPIDPIRFIGNHSSGKMGIAIADELAKRGATTTLVLGPSHYVPEQANVNLIKVQTASEMYEAVRQIYREQDILVFAAAVSDYTPRRVHDQKMKKGQGNLSIDLERTVDIAETLGKLKSDHQLHIGFALETENEKINAIDKVSKKNFDFIVLNSLNDTGAGFQHDTNKVTFIHKNNKEKQFQLKSKKAVAIDIVNEVELLLTAKTTVHKPL